MVKEPLRRAQYAAFASPPARAFVFPTRAGDAPALPPHSRRRAIDPAAAPRSPVGAIHAADEQVVKLVETHIGQEDVLVRHSLSQPERSLGSHEVQQHHVQHQMEALPSQRRSQLDQAPIQASGGLGLDPTPEVITDHEMAEQIKRLKKNRKQQQQRRRKATGGSGGGGGGQHRYVEEGHGGVPEEDKGAGGAPNEEEEEEDERWVAEVDRGVLITFASLEGGGNAIVKIRFREDMFDASEAQKWWIDNCERILNLYSVRKRDASPVQSDDEIPGSSVDQEISSHTQTTNSSDYNSAVSSSSRRTADHHPTSAAGGGDEEREAVTGRLVEWVVEDQPGVFITVRSLSDGTKQIRRVELNREKFGEVKARVWWEENKGRLHRQYT